MGCPQLVQKAMLAGTSVWQAIHWRVDGCACCGWAVATLVCATSDEPQCIQNDAPALMVPLQRGQTLVAASTVGATATCTGAPHSGQNFLPVTSLPQDVHVAISLHTPLSILFFLE